MLSTVRTANRAVRFAPKPNPTQPPQFFSPHEPPCDATVQFVGVANRHGSLNRHGSCAKQTAAVRDVFLTRFSDGHMSCAAFTSYINPPSPLFSQAVILSQVFHSPSILTRRCRINSRLSHRLLTHFAFTHTAVFANNRIFAHPPHSRTLVTFDRLFAAFVLSAHSHMPMFSHKVAFSLVLLSHSILTRRGSRIRSHFLCFFTPLALRGAALLA